MWKAAPLNNYPSPAAQTAGRSHADRPGRQGDSMAPHLLQTRAGILSNLLIAGGKHIRTDSHPRPRGSRRSGSDNMDTRRLCADAPRGTYPWDRASMELRLGVQTARAWMWICPSLLSSADLAILCNCTSPAGSAAERLDQRPTTLLLPAQCDQPCEATVHGPLTHLLDITELLGDVVPRAPELRVRRVVEAGSRRRGSRRAGERAAERASEGAAAGALAHASDQPPRHSPIRVRSRAAERNPPETPEPKIA